MLNFYIYFLYFLKIKATAINSMNASNIDILKEIKSPKRYAKEGNIVRPSKMEKTNFSLSGMSKLPSIR